MLVKPLGQAEQSPGFLRRVVAHVVLANLPVVIREPRRVCLRVGQGALGASSP